MQLKIDINDNIFTINDEFTIETRIERILDHSVDGVRFPALVLGRTTYVIKMNGKELINLDTLDNAFMFIEEYYTTTETMCKAELLAMKWKGKNCAE